MLQDEAQTIENLLDFIDTCADFEPVVKETARLRILEQHSDTEIATLTRAKAASTAMRRSDKVAQRAVDAGFRTPPLPELEEMADGRNAAILDPQYTLVGHPELRTPPQASTASPYSPRLDWEGRNLTHKKPRIPATLKRATLTATLADVADQREGSQCNATLGCGNATPTAARCATQRGARSDATHNRSVNRVADATPLHRRRASAHCSRADAALHAMRMTHSAHTRTVEGAHP
ncbi:hypothetical protein L1080_035360 [Rhodococcus sp. MSC1_016]|uniref:hypothetical protein n=1 Tax=Rhodococcus sp. MSC1_016 TaxID=2909266 RepID=UPI0027E1B281|nr:hypothetical protein [Rhodococcus sp. MSC1_016]